MQFYKLKGGNIMSKQKKKRFIIFFIFIVIGIGVCFIYNTRIFQRTSAKRLENKYEKEITPYVSKLDADKDGVDDQTDILQSVLAYIETNPRYKSKYYSSGYSNDCYGVCTDVVANGFLGAGYDLRSMVQEDISAHPEDYDIKEADLNIDFRRVKNLKVFFTNHAQNLTTDVHDIEEWQGGDIVIFENHIGIVSDHRNENGVPYVIHHNDPYQKSYEEDMLETREDIVGHYRFQ